MGAGKGKAMVKIRKSKDHVSCLSCRKRVGDGNIFDIGFIYDGQTTIVSLCDGCMHELLQKLVIVGSKYNEVR